MALEALPEGDGQRVTAPRKSGGSGVSRRVGLRGVRHLSPEATLLTGPEPEQEPRPGPACPHLPASASLASPSLLEDPALTGEVLVQPGSEFLVSPHGQLPGVKNTLWLLKMLSVGEAERRVHRNPLCYFYNFF